jgi:hypothetical protein
MAVESGSRRLHSRLIARRHFLTAASAAALTPSLAARPQSCAIGNCGLPATPNNTIAQTAPPLGPPRTKGISRPIWSRLSPAEKQSLAATLTKAYGKMAKRGPKDKRSLWYQAWLHAWYCGGLTNVHETQMFLPWHRGFLYVHERLLQAELNDCEFRLPVWDWENCEQVPWFYNCSAGLACKPCKGPRKDAVQPIREADLTSWLHSDHFEDFAGQTYKAGQAFGLVHSNIHGELGGYLPDQSTAAADPVFFGHHANIDRYWVYWWEHYKKQFNQASWQNKDFPFVYYDETGQPAAIKLGDLLDTEPLGYRYDQLPNRPVWRDSRTMSAIAGGNRVTLLPDVWTALRSSVLTALRLDWDPFAALVVPVDPLIEWLADLPRIDIPIQVEAVVPVIEGGKYYAIEMRTADRDEPIPIGVFGVFMSEHHRETRIYPSISMELGAVARLGRLAPVDQPRSFDLIYGVADSTVQNGFTRPRIVGRKAPFPVLQFDFLLSP